MKTPLIISIDIGLHQNTGVALYLPQEKRYLSISSMDLIDAYNLCLSYHASEEYAVVVVVENTDLDSNIFGAGEALKDYFLEWAGKKNFSKEAIKMLLKHIRNAIGIGRNVGKNQGLSILMVEKLKENGIIVAEVAPSARQEYGKSVTIGKHTVVMKASQLTMPTKVPAEPFKEWTKHEGSTNEHGRDAACMVFGKTYFFWTNWARTQKTKPKKKNEKLK